MSESGIFEQDCHILRYLYTRSYACSKAKVDAKIVCLCQQYCLIIGLVWLILMANFLMASLIAWDSGGQGGVGDLANSLFRTPLAENLTSTWDVTYATSF